MSRPSYNPRESYLGDGGTDTYSFDFKIYDKSELLIKCYDGDYEPVFVIDGNDGVKLSLVEFDPIRGGGSIQLSSNLANGYHLLIMLNPDFTQPDRYRNAGDFTLDQVEQSLDVQNGQIQRLAYLVAKALKLADNFDGAFDTEAKPVAGGALVVNDLGNALEFKLPSTFTPVILFGSGAPSDDLGSTDSVYVDVDTGDMYKKIGGSWVLQVSFTPSSGGLPAGGDVGDFLEKLSSDPNDAEWKQANFSGISRFGAWSSSGLLDTITKILNITYTAPSISLSGSSNSLREKGTAVTSLTLTAAVTKQSDPIAEVRFYDVTGGNTLLDTQTSGGAIPAGGSSTYNWTGSFSDNHTFRAEADDDGSTGGPTTVSSTTTYSFVYPYYVGAGASGLSAASVAGLTKRVINESTNRTETIAASGGQVFYFAYPASYGVLTSILDVNNFETIGDWTLRVENITGLDGNPVSYNIYEFDNPVTAGSYQYTFKQ